MGKSGTDTGGYRRSRYRQRLHSAAALTVALVLTACGGGGGAAPSSSPVADVPPTSTTPPSTATTTVITGKATYERVPHDPFTNGLLYTQTYSLPIRGALVDLVDAAGRTLETTLSDEQGNFRFSVSSEQEVSLRVRALMRKEGMASWDIRVIDNVDGDALYALASAPFVARGDSMTRNLEAASGWTGSAYTETRAAAPFAILDTVYESVQKLIETNPTVALPPLDIHWSTQNRPTSGDFSLGEIGSSLFRPSGGGKRIYILGAANADTDEYDSHVIAHEFMHYVHHHFGRSDSLGGSHSVGQRLDPRVAFGEGVASAFAAMILDDPNYVDTLGFHQAAGVNYDIENGKFGGAGWYNEGSVKALIYDLYDASADGGDNLALGFSVLFEALTGPLRNDVPFVTIHAFIEAVKRDHPAISGMLDDLAAEHGVRTVNSDAWGSGEDNSARLFDKVLPIYTELPLDGSAVRLCTLAGSQAGSRNKLSNRRFLRFEVIEPLPNQALVITANGPAGSDPDLVLHQSGRVQSSLNNMERTEKLRRIFTAGEYVLEIYDYSNITDDPMGNVCFDISVVPE